MDTDRNVWNITATVSSMDKTNEESSQQEFETTTTNLSNLERIGFGDT